MSIHFDLSLAGNVFFVPNRIVDKYINTATHTELKVLLYIIKNAQGLKTEHIISDLLIDEATLNSAVETWITRGILAVENNRVTLSPPTADFERSTNEALTARRPSYSFIEIEKSLSSNPSLRSVLQAGQGILKRSFSQTEYEILYSLYDYYGISPEAIMLLFSHCAEIGQTSAKAIESVAILWHKNEIFSSEEAENFIHLYRARKNGEGIVRRVFGLGERKLTPKEKTYISHWFNDLGFGEDLVELAYNKCVDTIGKFTFSYIDKILESYKIAGVTTVEAANALPAPEKKAKGKKSKEPDREASFDINKFSDWAFNSVYGDLIKKDGE